MSFTRWIDSMSLSNLVAAKTVAGISTLGAGAVVVADAMQVPAGVVSLEWVGTLVACGVAWGHLSGRVKALERGASRAAFVEAATTRIATHLGVDLSDLQAKHVAE